MTMMRNGAIVDAKPERQGINAMVHPGRLKSPLLLSNGTLLSPPDMEFACACCFWKEGVLHIFSSGAYAKHLQECPNATAWRDEAIQVQAALRQPTVVSPSENDLGIPVSCTKRSSNPPKLGAGLNQGSTKPYKATTAKAAQSDPITRNVADKAKLHIDPKIILVSNNSTNCETSAETSGKSPSYKSTTNSPVEGNIPGLGKSQTTPPSSGLQTNDAVSPVRDSVKRLLPPKKRKSVIDPDSMQLTDAAVAILPEVTEPEPSQPKCPRVVTPNFTPALAVEQIVVPAHTTTTTTRKSQRKRTTSKRFEHPAPPNRKVRLDYKVFKELWDMAEVSFLERTVEDVEHQKHFKSANTKMNPNDTKHQASAQYGRIEFVASAKIIDALAIEPNDTFLDIGHGLANVVLQASYVKSCTSRGIEVVEARFKESERFRLALESAKLAKEFQLGLDYGKVGSVQLLHGSLEDPKYFDFLTKPEHKGGKMKVFFNNYGGVFSERSAKKGARYLDDYVAGQFCSMPEGSILITCSLLNLPGTAPFYKCDTIDLGPAKEAVSWAGGSNKSPIIGHVYTRVGPTSYVCGKCGKETEAYMNVDDDPRLRVPKICCMNPTFRQRSK